ncbi:solute carrier family 2, facilitated glucose transporter member 11-like [Hypanus sabinus]|uniref:solute carrier family 2, facilitated glucose transporter member 11-like n=1 Tax=Hypanus sabinus TaxID=79690 RepID=UPI0028C4CEB1|nr:solute carrier family 2, facilitated glucose transporter member 11-like [Hypanus sabinus]XP_059844371.1 solute carrier family 2, facilitated glucose transporter member 11-like [Hypanus sabinus]XP_059844372.1 solute carrier family 2, facilitated glucose transporter member 11-like [Hypanus sabinus]XP_059844373.1 solute carrier family 2, facilitated glucose transporter member 11-like [Hypanus sabinus]
MDLLQMRGLLLTIFAACIGGTFQYGLNLTIINAPTIFIQMFINETWIERYGKPLESAVITLLWTIIITAFCVGGLVGAIIAGPMAITCGRRNSLLLSNIFVLIGTLLVGLSKTAKSFEMILIGRFFTGINSGMGMNINPMYLGESAPKKIRGIVALSYAPFTAAGLVTGQALGLSEVLGREETWPILLSASAVPALIQLAILPWCPESPRYLLIDRDDKDMCMKALKQLRGNANLTSEIDEMLEEQSVLKGENAKKIWDMFVDRSIRRQLMITFVLGSAIQLCGNDAMYYYAAYVFRAVGISEKNIPYVAIGTGCCELVTALTSNLFIDRAGRRLLLMGGYGLMVICGIFFTISLALQDKISWMPYMSVISIFASILSFGIGPAGVTGIIPMEIFDQTARPAAYMINGFLFWINYIIIGLTFPFIVEGLGSFCYVPFLSLSCFFVVFIGVFLPETKGKTFLEISKEFRKQNFRGLK